MNTEKHDEIMARTVPVTVGELAELAHEANALQADVVGQADNVRYLRDSLRSSNDARAVLVDELHKLDDELRNERAGFTAMTQTALTLRTQLAIETAKHARATQHIARMVTGQGWPEGRRNPYWESNVADAALHLAERDRLRAEVARLTEGLASAHAAQGIVPLRFAVGDYVTLAEAHNDGVVGRQYRIGEAKADSSLPYYLDDDAQWVPESAVVEYVPTPEPRPFKVGDRVETQELGRGVVMEDDGDDLADAPWWVLFDNASYNRHNNQPRCIATSKLTRIEWEPGEGIEVGVEVEYVGSVGVHIGARGVIEQIRTGGNKPSVAEASDKGTGMLTGAFLHNLRRVS